MPTSPVFYSPSVETVAADEAETQVAMVETLRGISETTAADYGHAVRSVHAKSHALVEGTLTVVDNLPTTLAQGMFARSGSHPVIMRFSTSPGDLIDDKISTPRGLAIKVFDVEGVRLTGSEGDSTQDFLMIDGPVFLAPDAKSFLKSLKQLAGTTDKAEGAKKILSAALRGAESVIEAFGGQSGTIIALGGHPISNPLGDTYYSETAYRYGDHIAKFSIVPVSPELTALTKAHVDLSGDPNGLRAAVGDHFRAQGGAWEMRVQLCTNLEAMPVEDATVLWPEDQSPYVTVARITVGPQTAWSAERSKIADDGLAFSPWHGLAAHQPLGSVNRARKSTYQMSAEFRGARNGCPMHEPRTAPRLAD